MTTKFLYLCRTSVVITGVAMLLVGCGRREPAETAAEEPAPATEQGTAPETPAPEEDRIASLFMQAEDYLFGGQTNEALAVLRAGLENPELAPQRQHVFNGMIRLLLMADMTAEAKQNMLAAYRDDEQLALGGLGLVYGQLQAMNNPTGVVEWTETVLEIDPLPHEVRRAMREWNLLTHIQLGNDDRVLQLAGQLLEEAPANDAVALLSRAFDQLFDRGRLACVDEFLQQADRRVTSDPDTQQLMLFVRMRLRLARSQWDSLQKAFPDAADKLNDHYLYRLLRMALPALVKASRLDLADGLCETVIDHHADKTQSMNIASRQWLDNAAANDIAAIPVKIEALRRANLAPRNLAGLFMRHFYRTIDDAATVEAMQRVGQSLIPLAENDDIRDQIRTMVLDAAFVLNDFDAALRILETGIAGRDANWHAMAISKVKAHKALANDQPLEAVRHFRDFMSTLAKSEDEHTSDPSTGMVYSKEMILGRNAKRIGDLLGQAGQPDAAAKAYDEARAYYNQALEKESDEETSAAIRREIDALPNVGR